MPVLLPFFFILSLGAQAQAVPAPKLKTAGDSSIKLEVLRTLKVGGDGGWDYVTLDSEARRVYMPRSSRVMVLDLGGKKIGEIPGTEGVHGVALAKELDRGFTSNGRANTMTVFKLSTLEVIKEVKTTGENPDAILYDAATRQVFTFNGRGKNATVFNAETLEVTGTIPMGGKPEFSVCDGKGRVFVNVEDTHELLAINARTRAVESRWSLKPLEEPSGLAIDVVHQRLFAVGRNKLMAVVDATNGKLVTSLPIGEGCDAAAFDAGTGRVYASNGEGTLTVINQDGKDHFTVTGTIPTRRGARTMAVDGKTHLVYLPTAEFGPAPEAKPGQRSRPPMIPDSFQIVVVGEAK